jgi:transposase
MIAGLISNRPLCLAHNKMFISKEEKERRVIDLYYNQGKTTREIAKELRVSPNYISTVLKKEEEKNSTSNTQRQSSSSLATKSYELLSQGKTPLQVAISLNIRQSEAAKYYREYWKLKRLHKLYSAYEELGDEGIGNFQVIQKSKERRH